MIHPATLRFAVGALGLLAVPVLAMAAAALELFIPGVIHHG
ncbi:hypothetical protein [Novosphingobium humi]|uniref:Uncharacterized protein n=1 Tax=Novosphingobium humi TaxID=2282397 RepID=A0ABY7TZZ8_9SPHN|nr:hypothetical protein [Novosphingobium humi]WCT78636.1 hypothetical protein PQ457_06650 [Novosphingobium humi]